ncbi:hypothetical protein V6N13_135350 [Hibiscus sabdariffa]
MVILAVKATPSNWRYVGYGENVNLTLSSSTESPKEPEEIKETPTSGTKGRKGKNPVEASLTECGVERDECIYCATKISCSTANGTNAMKRQTNRCKKAPFNLDKKQTILDFESNTSCNADGTIKTVSVPELWHFDQEEIRQALAKIVVINELPFSFVECEGFRAFYKVVIPNFVPPSCATIIRDCYALFIERRKVLQGFFKNLSSKVCLTTDTWTSGQNLSYMCLTAHFIDGA